MFRLAFYAMGLVITTVNLAFNGLGHLATLIGAESAGGGEWINYLLNGGPFAIVVLLILMDKLTTTGERDRLRIENETLRDEIKVLNESIRKEIVPPLVQMNELMRDAVTELSDRGHYYPPDPKGLRR